MAPLSEEKLIVFAKAPRPGMVKTRLAFGKEAECAAYQRLLATVLQELAVFPDVEIRFSPDDAEEEIRPWLRDGWRAAAQGCGDLGRRMEHVFAESFAQGAKRVVIVGSDCPYVTAEDIRTTWAQLQSCDLVIGPAADGGYWLIGLRKPQPTLFTDMPWSTNQVLAETLSRAKVIGLKTVLLRTLSDVDTPEDWQRFISAATPGR